MASTTLRNPATRDTTVVDLLRRRAAMHGDRTAYIFLQDGEDEAARITYADLDRRARAIAAVLQDAGAEQARALLLYPPGLEYITAFLGCLYAGTIAVPAYPPHGSRNVDRLLAIAADARPAVALIPDAALAQQLSWPAHGGPQPRWIATQAVEDGLAASWRPPQLDDRALAFLQYTSGSTSDPKGVMVTHGNLLHNQAMIRTAFGHDDDTVVVGWLPLYHDMGLIGTVLQPLYLGTSCMLMSPAAFLQRPVRWLAAISRYRATTSGGPNFAYDLCVDRIRAEERAGLDLRSWRIAFNGAEPVRAETMHRFARAFEPCGFDIASFYPCYGLAEATLLVSGAPRRRPPVVARLEPEAADAGTWTPPRDDARPARVVASCGGAVLDQRIAIVDPRTDRLCGPDESGEIYVAGDSVCAGYWNRPEESEATFRARVDGVPDQPFLKTGDLGFLRDGELFITGRLKDLVIIRGRNHHPEDLEWTVARCHRQLRGLGAAFALSDDADGVAIVQEIDPKIVGGSDEALTAIREALVEAHEIRPAAIALVKPGAVPRTSSGKVQRQLCRRLFLAGRLEIVGEWRETRSTDPLPDAEMPAAPPRVRGEVEKWLRLCFARRLGIAATELASDEPLGRYGLDSLKAIECGHAIEQAFAVTLGDTALLHESTLTDLTTRVLDSPAANRAEAAAEDAVEYGLSEGQRALAVLHELAPDSAAYNITAAFRAPGLEHGAFTRALEALAQRHPVLRSTFDFERLRQSVHPALPGWIRDADASTWSPRDLAREIERAAHRPFDLRRQAPIRATLLRRHGEPSVVIVAVHHLVADFWSLATLTRELGELYSADIDGVPPTPRLSSWSYAEYVRWQAGQIASDDGERQFAYWQRELAGDMGTLALPFDRPRPAVATYRGAAETRRLSRALSERVSTLARTHGVTLHQLLLTAFQLLLSRYTGHRDVVVGTPVAGRERSELAGLVGYLVNTLAIRSDHTGDATFLESLDATRMHMRDAIRHQDYPFVRLVERLRPQHQRGRSPLFQAFFVLHHAPGPHPALAASALNEDGARVTIGRLELESIAVPNTSALWDVTLRAAELDGVLRLAFVYSTDVFEAATMQRMLGCLECLLDEVTRDPTRPMREVPIVDAAERRRLLVDWNAQAIATTPPATIPALVARQAAQTPDAVCLEYETQTLTYRRLDEASNQVARWLRSRGVAAESRVGVCLDRSLDLVTILLGILKAGGAYVPFDPDSPPERLQRIARRARPVLLIVDRPIDGVQASEEVVTLDEVLTASARQATDAIASGLDPDHLACVLFTSGSTGEPKGVMSTHRGLCNHLQWMQRTFRLAADDRVAQKTPLTFDVSIWECFWPLIAGARVVVARPQGHRDSRYLASWMAGRGITTAHFVPSMLQAFLEEPQASACVALRRVLSGGEALPSALHRRFTRQITAPLYNMYGPCEASIDTTGGACTASASATVPIGRPIDGARVYVLDPHLEPVPIGAVGHLYIGGVGLARGYTDASDLTAARFIPDPLSGESGARLYDSGDLARYRHDGQIEFIGRLDHQVKLRGYRVEIEEIEATLAGHPDVRAAAVVADTARLGHGQLLAYVVPRGPASIAPGALRSFLKERLAPYQVPASFTLLDRLPLLPSGKVNRAALPAAAPAGRVSEHDYVAPRTPMEQAIAGIWADALGVDRVGIHDDFFDLGGHSVLAMQIVSRMKDVCHIDVPLLATLFQTPTIAELTATMNA